MFIGGRHGLEIKCGDQVHGFLTETAAGNKIYVIVGDADQNGGGSRMRLISLGVGNKKVWFCGGEGLVCWILWGDSRCC